MSRSVFAKHFQRVTGMNTMPYVARWRMRVADELLRSNKTSFTATAEQLGCQVEASFRKAFKETTDGGPGALRKWKLLF